MMSEKEIYDYLCYRDPRSPYYRDLYSDANEEGAPPARIHCACDNCFYGRDKLGILILHLMNKTDSMRETIISLKSEVERLYCKSGK